MDNRPIGVLDSGVGGFTVLRELQGYLPDEPTIYLGDSKRMPYGEKTNEEIIECVNSDIRFLEEKNVKLILLACNTASSLIDSLTSRVPVFSIVEAGVQAVENEVTDGNVGLIATRATVKNGVYDRISASHGDRFTFVSYGTPTLAQVINNHPGELKMLRDNIKAAVDPILNRCDTQYLLLGCTHFPIVTETISKMYPQLHLINPAEQQSRILARYLKEHDLEGTGKQSSVFVTGSSRDYFLSRRMLDDLNIYYDNLELATLDIDKKIDKKVNEEAVQTENNQNKEFSYA
ncbi:MAG: glutamate racemase [Eubacteriaceae bacterium]|jgi:glutamate racemase